MVQVDISTKPHVLATNCADMATLLNHPAFSDCMIVDESSPLCDDLEINPTPSETVQGGTGGTDVRTTASLQASGPVTKKAGHEKNSDLGGAFEVPRVLAQGQGSSESAVSCGARKAESLRYRGYYAALC